MDPITQGALGAAVTQAILGPKHARAWWLGALGGMAPDLDVFIRSSTSPILGIIYHRHFSHSLAFVPLGGILVALPWILAHRKDKSQWREIWLAATIGYATHAILDAFTSYGTLLWWPFSHERVAWSVIAIIDPRYTLPLILGVYLSQKRLTRHWVNAAIAWSLFYMALCAVQRYRALVLQEKVIAARGHHSDLREVFPHMGSNRRWRSLYRVGHDAQVDELWIPWFAEPKIALGPTQTLLDKSDYPRHPGHSHREHLRWFGKSWLYETHKESQRLWCDGRLSLRANAFDPSFCFVMDKEDQAVAKLPVEMQEGLGATLKSLLWPSPELRPAKEIIGPKTPGTARSATQLNARL